MKRQRRLSADLAAVEAEVARRLAAEGAVLLASGGVGIIAGLRAAASGGSVVIQRGHAVDVGGSSLRFCAMAGCAAVEVGLADRCAVAELEAALGAVDAGLFVDEPSAAREALIDLPRFLWASRQAGKPVLVHTRRPPPWIHFVDAGVDLLSVDLSAAAGQPGGLLVGRAALVARARDECQALPALMTPGDGLASALHWLLDRLGAAAG